MKKTELIKLKRLLQKEIERRTRINTLLQNRFIEEFLALTNQTSEELPTNDHWQILEELLKDFQITESNNILVITGNYKTEATIYYQETEYDITEVPLDSPQIEYQLFKDIETNQVYKAYSDQYIQRVIEEEIRYFHKKDISLSEFCHTKYGHGLTSELKEKYTLLNPYSSSENQNGFKEVQKDFFTTALKKGQPKAKQLVLTKYSKKIE